MTVLIQRKKKASKGPSFDLFPLNVEELWLRRPALCIPQPGQSLVGRFGLNSEADRLLQPGRARSIRLILLCPSPPPPSALSRPCLASCRWIPCVFTTTALGLMGKSTGGRQIDLQLERLHTHTQISSLGNVPVFVSPPPPPLTFSFPGPLTCRQLSSIYFSEVLRDWLRLSSPSSYNRLQDNV